MTNTGWTPSQIWALTLDDISPLIEHWRKHPPLRDLVEMIARFIGYRPASGDKPAAEAYRPTAAELKMLYPDGIVRG